MESRLDETDWEKADGGLSPDFKCLAGNAPADAKKTITVEKGKNNYEFEVKDEEGNVLLRSRQVHKYKSMFELVTPDFKRICRVKKALLGDYSWRIYSFTDKAFDGQTEDEDAWKQNELTGMQMLPSKTTPIVGSEKAPLYRSCDFQLNAARTQMDMLPIETFAHDARGKPGSPILHVEKVKNMFGKQIFQTCLPGETALVSYWDWDKKKAQLQVAKGTDITMHALLVVLIDLITAIENIEF